MTRAKMLHIVLILNVIKTHFVLPHGYGHSKNVQILTFDTYRTKVLVDTLEQWFPTFSAHKLQITSTNY